MSQRWCEDCEKMVDVTKKNYYAALALTLSVLFFSIVPFFGTAIGAPAIVVSSLWLLFTKNVCSECRGRKLVKRDAPSESEMIMKRYEDGEKKAPPQ